MWLFFNANLCGFAYLDQPQFYILTLIFLQNWNVIQDTEWSDSVAFHLKMGAINRAIYII